MFDIFEPDKLQCKILIGDALAKLKTLPDKSIHACVTSPPYYALRKYSSDSKEVGREQTPKQYLKNLCNIFMELHRVLRDDGCLYLNIGDTYVQNSNGNNYTKFTKQGNIPNSIINVINRAKNMNHRNVQFDLPKKINVTNTS